MNTTADLSPCVAAFHAALPDGIRELVRLTSRVQYLVTVAVNQRNWSPEQLAAECARNLDTAANVGAVITDRLTTASTITQRKPKKPPTRPFCCPDCAERHSLVIDEISGATLGKCCCRGQHRYPSLPCPACAATQPTDERTTP